MQGAPPLDPARASLQWALPLDPARGIMPLDPKLLYNIAPSVAALPATLGALLLKKIWGGIIPPQGARGDDPLAKRCGGMIAF